MVWLALLLLTFFLTLTPSNAQAYGFGGIPYMYDEQTGDSCPGPNCNNVILNPQHHKIDACPGFGLVRRMIPCIKETILAGTNDFLIPFSTYLANTVSVCCILAVMFWGIKMVTGTETAPLRDALVMAMKVGFVTTFSMNFGGNSLDMLGLHNGNFGLLLDIMEEMLSVVCGYVLLSSRFGLMGDCPKFGDTSGVLLVWDSVDCAIETLIGGIFSPFTITAGVVGFMTACLFSNTIGFTIGLIGIYLIYKMVYAIIKCCYIFLSSYMGVAFMVVISPMFIPMLLFKSTKTYFDKWLKLLTSFMIQPMVLFGYLAMLLAAFDTVVFSGKNSLYNSVAGRDPCFSQPLTVACPNGRPGVNGPTGWDQKLGDWVNMKGMYTEKDTKGRAITIDSKAIKASQQQPNGAADDGAGGKIANQMVDYIASRKEGVMNVLGIGGPKPKFFEIDIPTRTVDWDHLAVANGFDGSSDDKNTTSYILNVLVSSFMALITGYIFIEMLEIIPFIGSGMAMGGGIADGKALFGGLGTEKIAGGGSDFMKNLKFNAQANKG